MPTYTGTNDAETINGSATDDVITGGGGADTLFGHDGADVFIWNGAAYARDGSDLADGGVGDDLLQVNNGMLETFQSETTFIGLVTYSLEAGAGGDALFRATQQANVTTVTARGVEGFRFLSTHAYVEPPYYLGGGDLVYTPSANDRLTVGDLSGTGMTGLIEFDGGTGDDVLDAAAATNQILARGGTEADALIAGSADDQLFGEDGGDRLVGGAGSNLLDGGSGSDLADYSGATQSVVIDLNDGVVTNNGYGQVDTLVSIENLTGGAFNDVLIGEGSHNQIIGGAGADYLIGLGGNDILEGGAGASNTLQGGLGDDLYVVDANDTLIENAGEGTDSVRTSLTTYRLKANFENLAYSGSSAFNGLGNASDNEITGSSGADSLFGYEGADILRGGTGAANTLIGGLGDDIYYSRAAGDSLVEAAGEGHDTVDTSQLTYVLKDNFEDLIFTRPGIGQSAFTGTGNALGNLIRGDNGIDVLSGLAGDDVLRGMEAADTLRGGAGNDILDGGSGFDIDTADYSTAAAGAVVNLNSGVATNDGDGGVDTLIAIENLIGSAFDDTLIGNAAVNVLRGGTGRDTLLGLGGNDVLEGGTGAANTLFGGLGDDLYRVTAVGDTVVENAGEGIDVIEATVNVTMGANIETLRFVGTGAFTGVGNAMNNRIVGGASADILSGMGGDDILEGGDGGDFLRGGAGNDTLNGGGTPGDTADYTLAGSAVRVELAKTQVLNDGDGGVDTLISIENATGSAFDDVLVGNAGDNVLNGGLGRDTLLGGDGDDVLMGGSGAANTLQGGFGDDRYVVSAVGDSIVEFADQGIDIVETALGSMTLAANLENLTYTGAGAFTGAGNAANNIITSGAGADTLSGRGGDDIISAGGGVDTVVMSGLQSDYAVNAGAGYHSISDSVAGRDGLDILYGVERIRFSDGTVLDLTAPPAPGPLALEIPEALSREPAGLAVRTDDFALTLPGPWDPWNDF